MADLTRTIQELAGTRNQDEVKLYQCNVNSVDLSKRTANVTTITGTANLTFDALLTAGISDGLVITPEIDSMVYILMSKYTLPFIVTFSDIMQFDIMGGEFGGLVKVVELTQKLNNLENKVNEIITTFGTHTHAVTAVGVPTLPTSTPISGILTISQRAEIENINVKHGKNGN
jgi:hypothetical protein